VSPEISERSFEEAIECGLLQHGPDACVGYASAVHETLAPYGVTPPGGYRKRRLEEYDRALCLLPRDVVDFVLATQPREWKKLEQHHGAAVREQFVKRLAGEIERRGALDVLRNGIKDSGCKFQLAYFRPASGLNDETRRLYAANLFAIVRQLRYSPKNENSLDLVLFLNGLPIFTAELKNPLNGQDVEDAIRQYETDRDPREPFLAHGRCLAHFAVDPDLVYVTTQLAGPRTRFLPFNQGKFGGAGNPPVPPTRAGYATAYLWEETWARDSVLDLVRRFIHEVEEEDEKGRKTGRRFLIFPRYQQLDCVRRLVSDARARGAGQRYLTSSTRQGAARASPSPGSPTSSPRCTTRATCASSTRSWWSPTGACSTVSSRPPCASSSRRSASLRTSTPPRASSRRRSSPARRSSSPRSRSSR
jgi:type I restriction enzyme R subunit